MSDIVGGLGGDGGGSGGGGGGGGGGAGSGGGGGDSRSDCNDAGAESIVSHAEYKIMPITLKNHIPSEVRQNPRELAALLQSLKPDVKINEIRVMPSGDIRITGASPRDYSALRQDWPEHADYGKIMPINDKINSFE